MEMNEREKKLVANSQKEQTVKHYKKWLIKFIAEIEGPMELISAITAGLELLNAAGLLDKELLDIPGKLFNSAIKSIPQSELDDKRAKDTFRKFIDDLVLTDDIDKTFKELEGK